MPGESLARLRPNAHELRTKLTSMSDQAETNGVRAEQIEDTRGDCYANLRRVKPPPPRGYFGCHLESQNHDLPTNGKQN